MNLCLGDDLLKGHLPGSPQEQGFLVTAAPLFGKDNCEALWIRYRQDIEKTVWTKKPRALLQAADEEKKDKEKLCGSQSCAAMLASRAHALELGGGPAGDDADMPMQPQGDGVAEESHQ
eukprot:scaffold112292_cov17-Tisochrysis_lutea.AAC.3